MKSLTCKVVKGLLMAVAVEERRKQKQENNSQ